MVCVINYHNVGVNGIFSYVPANAVNFIDNLSNYNFTEVQSKKLGKIMGYDKTRVALPGHTSSGLAIESINKLIDSGKISKEDIEALIVVTQTPDYLMPGTSFMVHRGLKLSNKTYLLDINQGCAGFLIGMQQAYSLLQLECFESVLLVNVDLLSYKTSKNDRNSYPLIGDACTITHLVNRNIDSSFDYYFDGSGALALNIPAGGTVLPCSNDTKMLEEDAAGNLRSKEHLVMQGDAVYGFVQDKAATLIESFIEETNLLYPPIDKYYFHQPNKFLLTKLFERLSVPKEMYYDNLVEGYGNSSGCTIPLTISLNSAQKLTTSSENVLLSGFGVGLTWAACRTSLSNLEFLTIEEFQ